MSNRVSLATKLAAVEADLLSAYTYGEAQLHAEMFNKLAATIKSPEDLDIILGALAQEAEKTAAYGSSTPSPNIMRAVAAGAFLAPPLVMAAKFIMGRQAKEKGWSDLGLLAPQLVGQNPVRARMIYDLLHDTSPNLATNTPLAADLMKQMMAMPQVDMGTVKALTEVSKNMRVPEDGVGSGIIEAAKSGPAVAGALHMLTTGSMLGKTAYVKATSKGTAFDWGTEAAKAAGLTDAFSGSGTNLDQANNAFLAGQADQDSTMLPLDSVVKELIAKEQELAQREEILAQQEQQMQQAIAQLQQMGTQYQQQTGVDPNTGQVAQTDPNAQGAPADPNAQGAPADAGAQADPNAQGAPADAGAQADPNAQGAPADPNAQGAPADAGAQADPSAQSVPADPNDQNVPADTSAQADPSVQSNPADPNAQNVPADASAQSDPTVQSVPADAGIQAGPNSQSVPADATPTDGVTKTITIPVPVTISVKMGEMQKKFASFEANMLGMFRS